MLIILGKMNRCILIVIAASLLVGMKAAAQSGADCSKLTPLLIEYVNVKQPAASRSMKKAPATAGAAVGALVKLADGQDAGILSKHGCAVIDRVGNIYIAIVPVASIAALSREAGVLRMEANKASHSLLDSTAVAVRALPAYGGLGLPQAYTGKGVVVGVADVGFDFTHPMFTDAGGQLRIKQVWDIYTGGTDGYKHIGTTYDTPEKLRAAKGTCDSTQYHGTHVMGIAAGGMAGTGRYRGIAYESDIVASLAYLNGRTEEQSDALVRAINTSLQQGIGDTIFNYVLADKLFLHNVMEILAIKHIMDYAEEHGQPCVVNCSFGAQMELEANYDLQEELMNNLTGPGRIIVCSAGNSGDGIIYKRKPANETFDGRLWFRSSLTPGITLRSASDFVLKFCVDMKNGMDTLRIPSTAVVADADYCDTVVSANLADTLICVAQAFPSNSGTVSYRIMLQLPTNTANYVSPSASLVVESDGEVEIMGQNDIATFNRLNKAGYAVNAPYTVCVPGIFDRMIQVGLMSFKDSLTNISGDRVNFYFNANPMGQIVSWSGAGPTLAGKMKPDIAAPGHNVVSALSSHVPLNEGIGKMLVEEIAEGGKTYYLKAESGTSMSAPVVTGIIALWLQADPTLTPEAIKTLFAKTAIHPEPDAGYPNHRYGYGLIDAYKGLLEICGISGIEHISAHQPAKASFVLSGKTLHVEGAGWAMVSIYGVDGRLVMKQQLVNGTVDLSQLAGGIYAVQLDTGDKDTTGSTLIRL
jgi:subtilisin family serine protease